ncbi:MAG: lysyl-tRNA synthetase [Parcubacteria group bacterium GW2011_GWF2_38_76]|nr:MAG: lysyl-tRNA synthetase [Parcubacteria group bacterium GW2011_GWF2_38_76]HBM46084.1 lysine--tRNA ligase [Patescibacteria group bacterium]
MASIEEIREERIKKLNILKEKGIDVYPARVKRDFFVSEILERFEELTAKENISLVGRVMALRGQGAIIFFNFYDGTGTFQGLLKKGETEDSVMELFSSTVDIGDFIEIYGNLFITKRGEKTLQVKNWKMLAKSLRPLPGEYYGFKDEEERLRKRYLDILVNEDIKDRVLKRTKFWSSIRNFLVNRGFAEIETPVLENTAGGAEARPFITHHNALDMDVFLRISAGELWQKRLMIAGLPKVFEIGRIFRNEGMDAEHLQDYTQLEFYQAYSDYREGMEMVKEMYRYIAKETFGTLQFSIKGFDVDLEKEWGTYDYVETINKMTGIDIWSAEISDMENKLKELGVEYDKKGFNKTRAIDNLWKFCRKQIAGPGFLINVPVFMEPLAKRKEGDDRVVERFQVILAGSEVGKGFSELNDPIDQAGRFAEQAKLREGGDEEAQMYDHDFVEALEYGMPPTFGFGVSERLFAFFLDKPARDCQIFPLMRPLK